jgi:hypothetical protein
MSWTRLYSTYDFGPLARPSNRSAMEQLGKGLGRLAGLFNKQTHTKTMKELIQKTEDGRPIRKRVDWGEDADLVPLKEATGPFELWATIKESSKYYHQGLVDPTNRRSGVRELRIDAIVEDSDGYEFKLNSNQYRREDLNLFVKVDGKLKKL